MTPADGWVTIAAMKALKDLLRLVPVFAIALLLAGCAGSSQTRRTENLLQQAGFKPVTAQTASQEFHLKSLPPGKVTVAHYKGKTFYVYPEPEQHRILVGNLEQYQTYQQLVTYQQLQADNHVMGALGEDTSGDDVRWAEWTDNTGWTYGGY